MERAGNFLGGMLRQLRKIAAQRDDLIAKEKAKTTNLPSPDAGAGPAARTKSRRASL